MPKSKAHRVAQVTTFFDQTYGRDATELAMWQRLCNDIGVHRGVSITQCKKLKGKYVNIIDFVAAKKEGREVHVFQSYRALQGYIQKNGGKTFPLDAAKGNPILKWMLIQVY